MGRALVAAVYFNKGGPDPRDRATHPQKLDHVASFGISYSSRYLMPMTMRMKDMNLHTQTLELQDSV